MGHRLALTLYTQNCADICINISLFFILLIQFYFDFNRC